MLPQLQGRRKYLFTSLSEPSKGKTKSFYPPPKEFPARAPYRSQLRLVPLATRRWRMGRKLALVLACVITMLVPVRAGRKRP
jgi:hypothetical protein